MERLTLLEEMNQVNRLYFDDPKISKEELKDKFNKDDYDAENLGIVINLYMNESGIAPDKKLFNEIITDLSQLEGLPRGSYSVYLHDNNINKLSGMGNKDNSLEEIDIIR